jgi:hypothetical protein
MIDAQMRKGIEEKIDDLVEKAHKLIEDTKIADKSSFEKAQFRNLLDLASSTDSVKVIENFIYYQMGRDSKAKSWRFGNFGEAILNEIRNQLPKIANQISADDPGKQKEVLIELIRLFFGYANRYFIYQKGMSEQ